MMKLGLAPVDGINRVVLRKDKTLLFVVPNPEVFRKGDTWVVLGEARVEDPNQRAREMAAAKVAENIQPKTKVRNHIIMSRNFPYRFCDIRKKFCDIRKLMFTKKS